MVWGYQWQRRLGLAVVLAIGCISCGKGTIAQVVQDTTLGAESSTVNRLNFPGVAIDVISGGARRGTNLFHSFEQFSVSTGQVAFFNNAANIQTIITRVTGSSISHINGLIAANGNANLFLLNPNGIIMGPNAALSIGGSFLASTANSLNFADGTQFRATNPQTPPLLTVTAPVGLGFTGVPRSILVQSSLLLAGQTNDFGDFLLVGGNVALEGIRLQTSGRRVELGGLAKSGTVGLIVNGDSLRLQFPGGVARANVSITSGSRISVSAGDGGSLAVHAGNLNISESQVLAGIEPGSGMVGSQAGNVDLNGTGAVAIADSLILNTVGGESVGKGGHITITSGSFSISNSSLSTTTFGQGKAGDITIQATDAAVFSERGSAISGVASGAVGDSGKITVTARSVSVTSSSFLGTNTFGQGRAGDIIIQATDAVLFDRGDSLLNGTTGVSTNVSPGGVGDGGRITITGRSLSLINNAQLVASTNGQGNAGGITIRVDNTVRFDSFGGAQSIVLPGATGKAGDIEITAGTLLVTDGASIGTITRGQGDAANIVIRASDRVHFDRYGTAISGVNTLDGVGEGGNIQVFTRSLSITNGSRLSASTSGQGNAGNILVDARDQVSLDGTGASISLDGTGVSIRLFPGGEPSGLFTDAESQATGRGGEITVNTDFFRVANGAVVNTQTFNFNKGGNVTIQANQFEGVNGGQVITTTRSGGQAGNIVLNVADQILLAGSDPTYEERRARLGTNILENEGAASGLYANTTAGSTGNGGSIFINPVTMTIRDGARVTVDSQGSGQGGSIQIQAGSLTLNNRGVISAETASNQGGNITLQLQNLLLLRHSSQISTTAGINQAGGNGGNVIINAPFIVAVPSENSDISANAFTGRGGRVEITAQGIFGLQFRPRLSPLSDITASSEFGVSGTVTLNTPDVDPSRGLAPLPVNLVDPTTQIAQGCRPGGTQSTSSFVATGREGLPPSPMAVLQGEAIVADWITLEGEEREAGNSSQFPVSSSQASDSTQSQIPNSPIIEAQGWIQNGNGDIWLVSSSSFPINTCRQLTVR